MVVFFFFQAEDGIRDRDVTGVQTCALPISHACSRRNSERWKPSGNGWRIVSAITRGPAKPMSARGSARITSPSIRSEERRVGKECRARGAAAPCKKSEADLLDV